MSDENNGCTVTVDENGKRHFRMKADPGHLGVVGKPLGGQRPHVELGPHLATLPEGIRAAIQGKIEADNLTILYEDGHELGVMIGDLRTIFVFPSVAKRRLIAEQLKTVLGAK